MTANSIPPKGEPVAFTNADELEAIQHRQDALIGPPDSVYDIPLYVGPALASTGEATERRSGGEEIGFRDGERRFVRDDLGLDHSDRRSTGEEG